MFKLPLKKLLFIVKLCFLCVLVFVTLSLFEYWRGGKRATRAFVLDPDEELFEKQILEDEARIVPGLGEGGRPAYLTGEDKRLGEEAEKKYAVNTYLSDRIAYNRTLKDFRNPACERVTYDAELPSTSVVIIFHNEPYSVVVRTIWSVLNTARRDQPWHRQANYLERGTGRIMKLGYPGQPEDSEYVYLKEIILVDDNSTLPELRGKLARYVRTRLPPDMVRILRLPDRLGVTRARHAGAGAATGEVLVFLDSHCEGNADWLRPLLHRIKHSPNSVLVPRIDVLGTNTLRYQPGAHTLNFKVGGFTFVGHFTWIDVPEREKRRRGSDIAPTWSPTMAGGLFAIRRAYYWELGAYDEQMAGWGGENLEMSFRIWQCGGTLETIPCSRVGHVFRSFHPYGLPANSDTHGINTARMAEVWMDDYAELFYLHRPDLRKNPVIGDVTHRKILREKLHCKSFQWFLDNVYREKYVPVRDSTAFGRVQNLGTHLCLDTMQREGEASPLGFYPCHSKLTDTQYLSLSLAGQLRDEERCAEVQFVRRAQTSVDDDSEARLVVMVTCRESTAKMQWRYIAATGQLQHVGTGLCVDARRARAGDDARARACAPDDSPSQRWAFDYMGDESHSGVLPEELEQVLGKIRGQRRKSRSLLSVKEEPGAGVAGVAAPGGSGGSQGAGGSRVEGGAGARRHRERRRHRSKKKQKKVHKNKFIVTIERGLANSSVEHLEMDIHCRHKRLYPNNSFVRDLVSILNDRDIRVINNGRVFEKNKVTDLDKERGLRQLEDRAQAQTSEPPGREEDDSKSKEVSTEMLQPSSPAPPPLSSQPPERDDELAPPHSTTKEPKPKKKHHKKKHSSPKYDKHEHSLLLSDRDDSGYHVAIGSGGNGTGAQLPTEGAPVARARETDDEWERDGTRSGHSRERGRRPSASASERQSLAPPRPDSTELWLREDLARGRAGGDSGGRGEHRQERSRAEYREDVDSNVIRAHERNELDATRDDRRPVDRPREGLTDDDRELMRDRDRDSLRSQARADAFARHAEVYQFQKVGVEDRSRPGRRGGRTRAQVLSEAQGRPYDREGPASRDPWVSHLTDRDGSPRDSPPRHSVDRESPIRHTVDRESPSRHTPDRVHHTDPTGLGITKRLWPGPTSADMDSQNSWDPWAPRAAADAAVDARKAARDPHEEVAQLVYGDVWARDVTPPPREGTGDQRVADLAKEVMMDYDEITETAPLSVPPLPRAMSREAGAEAGAEAEAGAVAARGRAASPPAAGARALRVRLRSNMTFNLGDELLNWRRMQMTGQESESGSSSDELDPPLESV